MPNPEPISRQWHHAPEHRLSERGAYMMTCATLHKAHHLTTTERLDAFQALLFDYADKFGWRLQAWAIFANHYHWVGLSPEREDSAASARTMISQLHEVSAKRLNRADNTPGRKVWYNYWDKNITFATSYYARLKYVHNNAVHHGLAHQASEYRWCSRGWLETNATPAFMKQLDSFKTDRLDIPDDFL